MLLKLVSVVVVNLQMLSIACMQGLKQGEITSPLLFSLFIKALAKDNINNGRHGVQLFPDMI